MLKIKYVFLKAEGLYKRFYLSQNFFYLFYFTLTLSIWWAWLELNQRPIGYEPTALTPELQAQIFSRKAV